MDHRCICGNDNLFHRNTYLFDQFPDSFCQTFLDRLPQYFSFPMIRSIDPADHICTECSLPVDCRIGINDLSGFQLDQLHGNGCSANVHSNPVSSILRSFGVGIGLTVRNDIHFLFFCFQDNPRIFCHSHAAGKPPSCIQFLL